MKNLRLHRTVQPHYPIIDSLAIDVVWVGVIKFLAKPKRRLNEIVAGQNFKNHSIIKIKIQKYIYKE